MPSRKLFGSPWLNEIFQFIKKIVAISRIEDLKLNHQIECLHQVGIRLRRVKLKPCLSLWKFMPTGRSYLELDRA